MNGLSDGVGRARATKDDRPDSIPNRVTSKTWKRYLWPTQPHNRRGASVQRQTRFTRCAASTALPSMQHSQRH